MPAAYDVSVVAQRAAERAEVVREHLVAVHTAAAPERLPDDGSPVLVRLRLSPRAAGSGAGRDGGQELQRLKGPPPWSAAAQVAASR